MVLLHERVRQIENAALTAIKKSDAFKAEQSVFQELKSHGFSWCRCSRRRFSFSVVKDPLLQNHLYLYLVLGDDFKR